MDPITQRMMMAASPKEIPPVEFLSGVNLTNQTSDASRSLTLSSGFSAGDMLVAMTGNRTGTAPTVLSGYTSSGVAQGNIRSCRVQYKLATSSSETISWVGAYGFLISFKNASVISKFESDESLGNSTTIPLPNISGLNTSGRGCILAGSFITVDFTGVSAPYSLFNPYGAIIFNNLNQSISNTSINSPFSAERIAFAVEIL